MRADPKHRSLSLEAETLLQENRLAEAVQLLRDSEGLSRRDAKARIQAHLDREPLLRVQLETARKARLRRFFLWFLLADLLIAAGIIYWLLERGAP